MASPSKVTEPAAGGSTPAMARSAEVLPAPFDPIMPMNSPRPDLKVDAAHRLDAAIRNLEAFNLEQGLRHTLRLTAPQPRLSLAAAGAKIGLDHLRVALHLRSRT